MGVEIRRQPKPTKVMEFKVELVKLTDLKSHEEIIPAGLEDFKINVVKDGIVKHPMIVDKNSMLVLDGHHRKNGLLELGFINAPAILIDYYDDDLVDLDTWYPRIKADPMTFLSELKKLDFTVEELKGEFPIKSLKNREITAVVGNNKKLWTVKGVREEMFFLVRERWLDDIIYYDEYSGCLKETLENETSIVAWAYTKKEVIEHASSGLVYLPKTTRHIVKYLYPNCNYPLSKLDRIE